MPERVEWKEFEEIVSPPASVISDSTGEVVTH
jgi:hypothetical protein